MFYSFLTVAIIFLWIFQARKEIVKQRVPTGFFARTAEHAHLFIEKLCLNIIGSHGKPHIPFIMTLWAFVFISNIIGLFSPYAATGDMSINLALALLTVGYVQWAGIKQNGVGGHLKHFAGPKMAGFLVVISGLLFFVEIVSEFAKIGSLTLRLFANIEGGHLVVKILNELGEGAGIPWLDMVFPVGAFLLPIKLLTAVVQAFVWAILTAVYVGMVTHEEHEHDLGDDHPLTTHAAAS